MFFDIEEEDILIRLLIERIENHNQGVVLRNLVHNCPYTGHKIVRNMLNSHYQNGLDNCRVMPNVFSKSCAIFRQRCMLQDSQHVTENIFTNYWIGTKK